MYGSTRLWRLHPNCRRDPHYVTVVYLDDDPVKSVGKLTPLLEQRWATGERVPAVRRPAAVRGPLGRLARVNGSDRTS